MKNLSLYIHIPYCVKKCLYCDFLSWSPQNNLEVEEYVKQLNNETRATAPWFRDYIITTIFFGGGTPSILSGNQIESIIEAVKQNFIIADDAEISMEVNPGTLKEENVSGYLRAGINRFSIGVQSSHEKELKLMGRIHTWEEFLESYGLLRKYDCKNINVDLMSSLPGQEPKDYIETIHRILDLRPIPEHISAYSLILEEGTYFYEHYEEIDEDSDRLMYQKTKSILKKAGYHRYEISNYALEGKECIHNKVYWERKEYLGLGIGASSMIQNTRFKNFNDRKLYFEITDELYKGLGTTESEIKRKFEYFLKTKDEVNELSIREQMEEYMFLGLRMMEGISKKAFYHEFKCFPEDIFGEHIKLCYRDKLMTGKSKIRLTQRGIDLSNYVFRGFIENH